MEGKEAPGSFSSVIAQRGSMPLLFSFSFIPSARSKVPHLRLPPGQSVMYEARDRTRGGGAPTCVAKSRRRRRKRSTMLAEE